MAELLCCMQLQSGKGSKVTLSFCCHHVQNLQEGEYLEIMCEFAKAKRHFVDEQ